MTPRESYNARGPVMWTVVPVTALGTTYIIPENRDRHALYVCGADVTIYMQPAIAGLGAGNSFQFSNLTWGQFTLDIHGAMVGEAWRLWPQNNGIFWWGESCLMTPDKTTLSRGPVEWYRQHLERKRRERKQQQNAVRTRIKQNALQMQAFRQDVQELMDAAPACAALLLDTPLAFAMRVQGQNAVGGGGGENGGEALNNAAPGFVGD